MYANYCTPCDIAYRLYMRHRFWFHGNPTITLIGDNGKFGTLAFDFIDEVVRYTIWIADRQKIIDAAQMAVLNFRAETQILMEMD
jgi:hypothetical protein